MVMKLTELINDHYNEFSNTEKGICAYILNNLEETADMGIQEFAKESLSSKSSVIRFSQKLGFTGFSELKSFMKWEVDASNRVDEDYSFFDQVLSDTTQTIEYLKRQDWREIYQEIHEAEHVYIVSTGVTQQIQATEFQRLFMLSGKDVRAIPGNKKTAEFQRMYEMLSKKDLVIILSLSGENIDLEEVVTMLQQKNVRLISITNYQSNWLSKNCLYSLYSWSSRSPLPSDWWLRTTSSFFVLIEAFVFGYNDYLKKVSG